MWQRWKIRLRRLREVRQHCKENTMVRIYFAFSLERKNETERWFSLCCPVGMSTQGNDPDEARGKDKNRSEGTVKRFPGLMAAVTLCFATKRVLLCYIPGTTLLMSCQHHTQAKSCSAGTGARLQGHNQSPALTSDHAGGGWNPGGIHRGPAHAGVGAGHTMWCLCSLPWVVAEGWLDFSDQALTSTGNYAPKCEPFSWTFSWL